MNILDRFSTHLREALTTAIRIAVESGHSKVEPLHLLHAISLQTGSVGAELLNRIKIDTEILEKELAELPSTKKNDSTIERNSTAQMVVSPLSEASRVGLEKAMLIAHENGHNFVGTEHLLSALSQIADPLIDKILSKHQVSPEELKNQLSVILNNASQFPQITEAAEIITRMQEGFGEELIPIDNPMIGRNRKPGAGKESALSFFADDLTMAAAQKKIDPVIGRETEIERIQQILCRRTKNNPVLLGDPGVGKTAIIEGLAKKIADHEVPDILLNKKIFALDMGLLIAGTIYRGEFEARLKQVVDEVTRDPNIILFIDEMHNIVGAGSNQGTMDAANILKPALARGQIRCIGATTPAEFKKYVENDAALERRFQPIYIKQPSVEDTIKILKGIKKNYEIYHNIKIADDAVKAAAELSDRYIAGKLLPDKAIDLLDETAAAKKLRFKSSEGENKLLRFKQQLETIIAEKEGAAKNDNFQQAVKLKNEENNLRIEIKKIEDTPLKKNLKPLGTIKGADVATQLAKIIQTPVERLLMDEKDRYLNLKREIATRIIGQDIVINDISRLVCRAQLQLSDPRRPMASFLFAGASGVGKTEMAKTLAQVLYPEHDALVRVDMSEFNESFSVSKLLGSPAGYVGYKESNQFTDKIKMNPYCVVLFDEADKAHRDVLKLLLQILENGEITDAVGKKISLKHAIIILTTSIGAADNKKGRIGFGQGGLDNKENEKYILDKLKEHFSPELINRLDKVCIFNNLTDDNLANIVKIEINQLNQQLKKYHTLIHVDQEIAIWLAKQTVEKENNARTVRADIRMKIEEIMSEKILSGKIKKKFQLAVNNNHLVLK